MYVTVYTIIHDSIVMKIEKNCLPLLSSVYMVTLQKSGINFVHTHLGFRRTSSALIQVRVKQSRYRPRLAQRVPES